MRRRKLPSLIDKIIVYEEIDIDKESYDAATDKGHYNKVHRIKRYKYTSVPREPVLYNQKLLCNPRNLKFSPIIIKIPNGRIGNWTDTLEFIRDTFFHLFFDEHPHIATMYESHTRGTKIMEDAGLNLKTFFDGIPVYADKEKNEEIIRKILFQILIFLRDIHEMGWIHQDIKLDNILIDKNGTVKLCDFGFSRMLFKKKNNFYGINECVGTLAAIAPEILGGTRYVSPVVDMWSLGSSLYTMITRKYFLREILQKRKMKLSVESCLRAICVSFPLPSSSYINTYYSKTGKINACVAKNMTRKPYLVSLARKLSPELLHLLSSMLTIDHRKRITAKEALLHPFFRNMKVNGTLEDRIYMGNFKCLDYLKNKTLEKEEEEETLKDLFYSTYMNLTRGRSLHSKEQLNCACELLASCIHDTNNFSKKWGKIKKKDRKVMIEIIMDLIRKLTFNIR